MTGICINLDAAMRSIEIGILTTIEDLAPGPEWAIHLNPIAERTGLPRDLVSATLRYLTDRGLTRFQRGLFTEGGEPAGSGYCLTAVGLAFVTEWMALEAVLQPPPVFLGQSQRDAP